ncbi:MAG: hypothetical protein ACJ8BW_05400, partial [Ktedonobacteraceae bacterium]
AFRLPGFPATASLRYMRSFVTQSALLIPLDRPLLPGYILNCWPRRCTTLEPGRFVSSDELQTASQAF